MFDVIGDEITFDGHRVGKLEGAWPMLRARVKAHLREMKTEDELEEEKRAEYDRGFRDASKIAVYATMKELRRRGTS